MISSVTVIGAMKQYPRRCTVAMYRGALAVSPRICLICPRQVFSTPSVTTTSGHTAASSVSLGTTCPACAAKYARTASGLGGRRMSCSPRHKLPLPRSRRNGPKPHDGVGGMVSPSLLTTS
jgi:hypothetical protein